MADTPNDFLSLEALKAIGKTLGQMTLYRIGHPAVAATLEESHRLLVQALEAGQASELTYSLDADKLIANARVIGSAALLPNSILSLFRRYHLQSVTFTPGIRIEELAGLCELVGLRAEQSKGVDASAFLKERGVAHILLNESIYAKVEKGGEVPASTPGAATAPAGAAGVSASSGLPQVAGVPPLSEQIASMTIEQSIMALVREVAKDPKEQESLYQMVVRQMQADVEVKVRSATDGIRREKTRVENEQIRTTTVLSNMAEGVVVVDDHGNILMMNPAAEDLYGVKLVDVAGKPLSERVKEEHLLTLATDISKVDDSALAQAKVEVLSVDDTRRTVRASTAVVQNEAGKPVGMVSVLTDVTKHKELQKMEREFVAHVTHELRAPLSSIRASLEILQGQLTGKLEPDDERIFGTALKNTDRLEDLIRNILDFSKLESGQMNVHPKESSAEQIAKEAVESLRPWCQKKGITLELSADAGLPPINADSPRTIQVLVNLLSNAIKFTPSGGRISVHVSPGAGKSDRFILFSVKDTGPGIAKEDQAKIFEKFVQIAAGERHVGGTGLGLAIAKALIHLQTGQMWVESEVGKGAAFFFTLPIYVSRDAGIAPVVAPAAPRPWWKRLLGLK